MSILLSDVQVKMSRIGVHTANASTNLYFPTVTIYYTDPKKKPVSTWIIELGSRFKKSDYLGKVICGDFFVIDPASFDFDCIVSNPPFSIKDKILD